MFDQLQRAINLSQKTGDKLIVFDSRNPKNSYVLIPFDEYERSFYENEEYCEYCDDECCDIAPEVDDEADNEFSWKNPFNDSFEDGDKEVSFDNDYKGKRDFFGTADDYLTEEERIDKINRDLGVANAENLPNESAYDKMDFLEGNFDRGGELTEDRNGKSSHWSIPKNIKKVAEEVIEEDRTYLEELTF